MNFFFFFFLILSMTANPNNGNVVCFTVQRQCCVCLAAWRRWGTLASVLCSLAKAAWLPGGRVHPAVTTPAALCTRPASRGPPPSPRRHHLGRRGPATTGIRTMCDEAAGVNDKSLRSTRTSALKDVTAPSFQPGHVFETQKSGVYSEARATLPYPVDVTGTHLRH